MRYVVNYMSMRINKWLAKNTNLSRRKADEVIAVGRVKINGAEASMGASVADNDRVSIDGREIQPVIEENITVRINKPVGYVCSRRGQGSQTIYDLLPSYLHHLKPLGRLDKDSSGLLLMSTDGEFIHKLSHPSFNHEKTYVVTLGRPLNQGDEKHLKNGVDIGDRLPSKLGLSTIDPTRTVWQVKLTEGRNRQIRRSFASVRHKVQQLHRTQFSTYTLKGLESGKYEIIL